MCFPAQAYSYSTAASPAHVFQPRHHTRFLTTCIYPSLVDVSLVNLTYIIRPSCDVMKRITFLLGSLGCSGYEWPLTYRSTLSRLDCSVARCSTFVVQREIW